METITKNEIVKKAIRYLQMIAEDLPITSECIHVSDVRHSIIWLLNVLEEIPIADIANHLGTQRNIYYALKKVSKYLELQKIIVKDKYIFKSEAEEKKYEIFMNNYHNTIEYLYGVAE